MAAVNGSSRNSTGLKQLAFLSESDPVSLLSSNNYLDQLVPIMKTHLKNNTVGELMEKLEAEGLKKDEELASLVHENEDKIDLSARDIGEITRNASGMNEQILDINDHLSKTSNLTFEKKFQLLALKKNINKIHESEILINRILQVLELTDKTHELIKNNKMFQALKSLNDLNSLNKEFDRDFIFLNNINASIPILKDLIRDESLSILRRSLGALETKFEPLGAAYTDCFGAMVARFRAFKAQNREFADYKVNSPVEISLRQEYLEEGLPDVEDFVKAGFVFDTLLIFKTLNQTEFLKTELNKESNMKRDKLFYPFVSSDSKNEQFKNYVRSTQNLQSFLNRLTGYLVFHKMLYDKIPDVISMKTSDLWENLSAKIYPHLKNLVMNEILEVSKLTEVKRIIGNFYLTMEHFKFNTDHIYNVLILTFKKHSQLSIHLFIKEFKHTSDEDDAMPMSIYDMKLYKKISNACWYKDERPESDIKFPVVLPFSALYPMACAQTRNFIATQQGFLDEYYKFDLNSLNTFIVEDVNNVLLNAIDAHFQAKLKESSSTEELAQNLINLEYFFIMSTELSKMLSKKYDTNIKLRAEDAFNNTRKKTEQKLFEVIDGKMFDLFDLIDWDWQTSVVNSETTYFIRDIGDFLRNLFSSALSKLPYSVKTLLLYRVFDLLAKEFLEHLNMQQSITRPAILNFDNDVSYMEQVTKDLNPSRKERDSEATDRDSLQSMFLQLRQRINLLKAGHLDEYSDQTIRMRIYDQIKPEEAVQLVNKIRQ